MSTTFSQLETLIPLVIVVIPFLIFLVILLKNLWRSDRQVFRYFFIYVLANILFTIFNLLLFSFVKYKNTFDYSFEFLPRNLGEILIFISVFSFLSSIILAIPLAATFFIILGLGFITGNRFITATDRKFEMRGSLWPDFGKRTKKLSRFSEIVGGLFAFWVGFTLVLLSLSEGYKFYCNRLKLQSNCNDNILVRADETVSRVNSFVGKIFGRR